MSRFGDTAANTGMLTLMNSLESTKDLNVAYKTVAASAAAAVFRIFLMPVVRIRILFNHDVHECVQFNNRAGSKEVEDRIIDKSAT